MLIAQRDPKNPLLEPNQKNSWEAVAAFNGCPVKHEGETHLFYRALSPDIHHAGTDMKLSTVGRAISKDGRNFKNREQFIGPEYSWEKFGCEDPRVVKIGDKYYIFYTAVSNYPFTPSGIKIAVAISRDLKNIEKKRLVTPFNSKAMSLFPEKIKGKYWGALTVDTDMPPSKICLAPFEKENQIWEEAYWHKWKADINTYTLPLQGRANDQVEFGAPPVKTSKGWLLVYSYIKNYFTSSPSFGVEAVLLDLKNPLKILGKTKATLLNPEEDYELKGEVPNIVFPSGALIEKNKLQIYYGAADTTTCRAGFDLNDLLKNILKKPTDPIKFHRVPGGPLLKPNKDNSWESKAVFNPGTVTLKGKVHLIYRAMSEDNTSVLGYARSADGVTIEERLNYPIYTPREDFEVKRIKNGNSGCEDPRLTRVGNYIYMLYTAFNGVEVPRVAMTRITVREFLKKEWNWDKPRLISPPGSDDKDACILEEKVMGKYAIFHRLQNSIDVSLTNTLNFKDRSELENTDLVKPRKGRWDGKRVGLSCPPLKTKKGWLMLYHGISEKDSIYRVSAILLDLKDPRKIKSRIDYPIFEPLADFEKKGLVPNVVFPCGAEKIKSNLYIYYGAADEVTGVAVIKLSKLLKELE